MGVVNRVLGQARTASAPVTEGRARSGGTGRSRLGNAPPVSWP